MIRVRSFVLCLCALLFGCADGGPVGSGINAETGISGNVAAVENTDGTNSSEAIGNVRVSVAEPPGIETATDLNGNFELTGDFSGSVTLRFQTAEISASETIDVPDHARVVLQDIVVERGHVRFGAARVLGFFGQIALVDCNDGTLLVNDRRATANQFLVHLDPDTVLLRGDGSGLECPDIRAGDIVAIEGAVQFADRTIIALTLTVAPAAAGNRPPISDVRFHGRVAVINCQGAMILLDDPSIGRTRLRLSAQTEIIGADAQPIDCAMIHVDDRIDGGGTINVRRPQVVDALSIMDRQAR